MLSLSTYLKNPNILAISLLQHFGGCIPDKLYLKWLYRLKMGYNLNLNNPKTFNEKLQWLKLYDRNPNYTNMVDKYSVKSVVKSIIGSEYIIPTLGVWEKPDDIEWDILPNQFVLKTTHGGGSGGVVICKDKNTFDKGAAISKLNNSMKHDIYHALREWPYKNVHKRIIAEAYLEDNQTGELRDYKFFCFAGRVKALFIASERQSREEPFFNFFDEKFNPLELQQGHPKAETSFVKPSCFDEMVKIAEKLSKGLSHVRVDLYQANNKVYFGEYTFYHFGGLVPFQPELFDSLFGDLLVLPTPKF